MNKLLYTLLFVAITAQAQEAKLEIPAIVFEAKPNLLLADATPAKEDVKNTKDSVVFKAPEATEADRAVMRNMTPAQLNQGEPWDSGATLAFAYMIGGVLADIASTKQALDNCSTCVEANPIYGKHPNVGKLVLINGIVVAIMWYVADKFLNNYTRKGVFLFMGTLRYGFAYHNRKISK
jgi:hypothetical protein